MRLGKWVMFLTISVFWQALFSASAGARDDLVPGSRYTSGRAAAMGDAFLPLGEDTASGLFYNPANLAKRRGIEYTLVNFSLNVNSAFASSIDFTSVSLPNLGAFLPVLTKASPKFVGGGGAFLVDFGMPGFALGLLFQSQLGGQLNTDGTVTYRSLYQLIPAIGTGIQLMDGFIRLGYSLQWVHRAVGTVTTAASPSLSYTDGIAEGAAFSHNFGVNFTLPMRALPSLNFVVRNAVAAHYIPSVLFSFAPNSSTLPATEAMTFDGSLSAQPHLGRGSYLNLVAQLRDILNSSNDHILGRLALGAELSIRRRIFFRGGWSGGYPSAGLGIKSGKSELSLTWYTAEIGTGYQSQGDTRFMMQYQVR